MTYSAEIVHANTGKPLRIRSAATRGKRMFTLGGKASSPGAFAWLTSSTCTLQILAVLNIYPKPSFLDP